MAESPERRSRLPLPRRPGDEKPGEKPSGNPVRRMRPRFWMIVLVLLAVNYLSVALFAPGKEKSVRDPVQPGRSCSRSTSDNVDQDLRRRARRSSGEFKNEVKYPDDKAEAVEELRRPRSRRS